MSKQIVVINLLLALAMCVPFDRLQGYGTGMAIKILDQIVVGDEISLKMAIKPYTYIRLKPNITMNMKAIVSISQMHDVIVQGPATLINFGIYIQNSTNIIINNIRVLNASIYGVLVYGSCNVVINQMTILDASRASLQKGKCVDITEQSANVTVSNTILGYSVNSGVEKTKGMLIANFLHGSVTNVSIHHNIFYQNYQRSPQISTKGLFDFRNNIISGYTQYGSRVRQSAFGNFENNFYIGGKKDAMVFLQTSQQCYCEGNRWLYNYTQWKQIPKLYPHRYNTPNVDTYNYNELLQKVKEWGCLPQIKLQRQIKQNILSYNKVSTNM